MYPSMVHLSQSIIVINRIHTAIVYGSMGFSKIPNQFYSL